MPETLWILSYAMLPVTGHWLGAGLAVATQPPRWLVGAALHGSAGIAIALVSMDLMPRIEPHVPVWLMMVLFLAGAAISVALAATIAAARPDSAKTRMGAVMVYAAVGADLVSDGLMTGAGFSVEQHLGLLLAAAQAVANIPGGFSAVANLSGSGSSKRRQLVWTGAAIALPVLASALLGSWLLGDKSPLVQHSALMVVVGLLLLATVEDIIPEGDDPRPPRWISTTAFTAGFVGLTLSSKYLQ